MSTPTTTCTENAAIVRQLFDAYEVNDGPGMTALLAPDFVAHGMPPEFGNGPEAMTASASTMHDALRDCRCEIEDVVAEGDRVAVRFTTRATQVGDLFGVPATDGPISLRGIEIYRLRDGLVVEYWGQLSMD